ncbi:tyrosine-type recombinase/integrase [Chungangia koreensis]|uniref:Tyrosine-type recombinase/integrase n=1 Tax=Chungangia koreensis TaxID=752657 RepID=A0ABV8X2A5_9LACT
MIINNDITPHSLRQIQNSIPMEAGAGMKELQERLGHSDINTTMNIYANMTNEHRKKDLPKV